MAGVSTHHSALTTLYKEIRALEWKLIHTRYLKEAQSKGKPLLNEQLDYDKVESPITDRIEILWNYVKLLSGGTVSPPNPLFNDAYKSMSLTQLLRREAQLQLQDGSILKGKESMESSNVVEEAAFNERYLCISVHFSVFCLDLSQRREVQSNSLQPLPVLSTVNLLEGGFPFSMGLFKLESHTYMIGGMELESHTYMIGGMEYPSFNRNPPSPFCDVKVLRYLCERYGVKATSRDTYRLSLANGRLSVHECNIIPPLNEPKIWPRVEKIGNEIHVIESFPMPFLSSHCPRTFPSHEVLNLEDFRRGWVEVPTQCSAEAMYIVKHILLGDRIYASSYTMGQYYMLFNSKTRIWEWCYVRLGRPFSIAHVAEIFSFGDGKCALEIHSEDSHEPPLYVVIAVGWQCKPMEMLAVVAYLVTSTGQVLFFQPLPHLFQAFEQTLEQTEEQVFKVDDKGNMSTMCAMIQGVKFNESGKCGEFVLNIATFNVVADELDKGWWSQSTSNIAVKRDFVKVELKNSYVYEVELDPRRGQDSNLQWTVVGENCCFL